jgi:hypothetical protein
MDHLEHSPCTTNATDSGTVSRFNRSFFCCCSARALWRLGKRVFVLIDHEGGAQLMEEVIREAKSSLQSEIAHEAPSVILCPPRNSRANYEEYLAGLMNTHAPDHLVSIERPCRAQFVKVPVSLTRFGSTSLIFGVFNSAITCIIICADWMSPTTRLLLIGFSLRLPIAPSAP